MMNALSELGIDIVFCSMYAAPPAKQQLLPGELIEVLSISDMSRLLELRGSLAAILVSRIKNLQRYNNEIKPLLPNVPLIYDAECITSVRDSMAINLFGLRQTAGRFITWHEELALVRTASAVIVTSNVERDLFQTAGVHDKYVVGYYVDVCPSNIVWQERSGVTMVGRFFGLLGGTPVVPPPNEDAVEHLLSNIMPCVWLSQRIELTVGGLGSEQLASVFGLKENVTYAGYIRNMASFLDQFRVFVAPTRYCAGIPLKVVEAWAHGIPVVLSGVLARQLGLPSRFLVANSANEFAKAITDLHGSSDLWGKARSHGLSHVEVSFQRADFVTGISDVLRSVGIAIRAPRPIPVEELNLSCTRDAWLP
jgi:glycosyltransferase involved in cell wall biosynthesis